MPITRLDSSTNCVTFYGELRATNGPRAARGMTLSNAAATSFQILNWFSAKRVLSVISLFLCRRKLNIFLQSWVSPSKSLAFLTSQLTTSSIFSPVAKASSLALLSLCFSISRNSVSQVICMSMILISWLSLASTFLSAASLSSRISESDSFSSRQNFYVPSVKPESTRVEDGLCDEEGHYLGQGSVVLAAPVQDVLDDLAHLVHPVQFVIIIDVTLLWHPLSKQLAFSRHSVEDSGRSLIMFGFLSEGPFILLIEPVKQVLPFLQLQLDQLPIVIALPLRLLQVLVRRRAPHPTISRPTGPGPRAPGIPAASTIASGPRSDNFRLVLPSVPSLLRHPEHVAVQPVQSVQAA